MVVQLEQVVLAVICAVLMVSAAVFFIRRGKETKNKSFYIFGGCFCALGSMVFSIIFGEYLFALILIGCTFILIVYALFKGSPSTIVEEKSKVIENTDVSDISGPMRLKDVFAWYFRFKLERKYGAYKAALIYTGIVTSILSSFMIPFCLLGFISVRVFIAVTVAIFVSFLIFYYQLREGQAVGKNGTIFL